MMLSCLLFQSHREFASDLFPNTDSDEVVLTADCWLSGQDAMVRWCWINLTALKWYVLIPFNRFFAR